MAHNQHSAQNAMEIDRLAIQLAKDPHSKAFMPLADEYGKASMWEEAASVLEDGLKLYPGFITAMVALGRAYDQMGQIPKAKAILEESVKLSPDNLRAHRTLIKIYQNQGLSESVLQSCAVILAVNPRDEEALSVQAAFGGPLKQKKELERPRPSASGARNGSAQSATEMTASAMETAPPTVALTPSEQDRASAGPMTAATPPPSSSAEVVGQLEAWLRTIEARRHDRATTDESHHKVS